MYHAYKQPEVLVLVSLQKKRQEIQKALAKRWAIIFMKAVTVMWCSIT